MSRLAKESGITDSIKKLYLSGLSGREVAIQLHLSKTQVQTYIKKMGISRSNLDWQKDKIKLNNAINISKVKRTNIPQPNGRKYNINTNLFKNLDDAFESYLFGIIFTDGSVSKNGNTISLMVSNVDKVWLDDIASRLNVPSKIDNRGYPYLTINSTEIGSTLNFLGIFNDKTKNPRNIIIPDNKIDFLRGLIDGDGCISISDNGKIYIQFGNTNKQIVDWVCDNFRKVGTRCSVYCVNDRPSNKTAKRPYKQNFYTVSCTGKNAKLLLKTIYYDGCFAIPRKYSKVVNI